MATPILRLAVLRSLIAVPLLACGSTATAPPGASAQAGANVLAVVSPPALATAGAFTILGGTAVTCTDATVLGNVGVSPGTSITQTSCPVTGTVNAGDTVAAQAQADFLLAYDALAAQACDQTLTTLDGQTLAPGVYCFDAAVTSTGGVLTLAGPATGTWLFKVGTLGTGALTGTGFSVVTPSGAPPPCGSVFWWTADAATVTDSQFVGTILAGAAITLTRGTFSGNAYSRAAVTITGDAVTGCASGGGGGGGGGGPGTCKDRDGEDDGDCQCREDDDDDHGMSSSMSSGKDSGKHGSRCGGHGDDDDQHHEGHGEGHGDGGGSHDRHGR